MSEPTTPHTPAPWRVITDAAHSANRRITSPKRPHIAKVYAQHLNDPVGLANAEHIVRCVNAHEALVKALEGMVRLEESEMLRDDDPTPELSAALAALALAS